MNPCPFPDHKCHRIPSWLQSLGTMTTQEEENALYDLAKEAGRFGDIVEIGSCRGHSTICLALGLKATGSPFRVFAVDPHIWENTLADFQLNLHRSGVEKIVIPVNDESLTACKGFNQFISLLFIDGLHDYENVKADFDAWMPKVMNCGTVALHDTGVYEGPARVAWEQMFNSRRFYDVHWVGNNFTYGKKCPDCGTVEAAWKIIGATPWRVLTWKRRTRILPVRS